MADRTSSRPKALLVEDEFLVALDVEEQLTDLGFDVIGPLGRVAEAVYAARRESDVAIAILDVNLAGEMSWGVARALAERGIPFFFVSGYGAALANVPQDLADARFLSKPVGSDLLRNTIDACTPGLPLAG